MHTLAISIISMIAGHGTKYNIASV